MSEQEQNALALLMQQVADLKTNVAEIYTELRNMIKGCTVHLSDLKELRTRVSSQEQDLRSMENSMQQLTERVRKLELTMAELKSLPKQIEELSKEIKDMLSLQQFNRGRDKVLIAMGGMGGACVVSVVGGLVLWWVKGA